MDDFDLFDEDEVRDDFDLFDEDEVRDDFDLFDFEDEFVRVVPETNERSHLDVARNALENFQPKNELGQVNPHQGYVTPDGIVKWVGHNGCHGPLSYYPDQSVCMSRPYGLGVTGSSTEPLTEDYQIEYLRWILGPNSPWKSIVKDFNPDPEWAAKHGIVLGDLDTAHRRLTYNFWICTRFQSEYKSTCKQWGDLVKAGIHPALAFACSAFMYPSYTGGHGGLNSTVDPLRLAKSDPDLTPRPGHTDGVWTDITAPKKPAAAVWDGQWSKPWDGFSMPKGGKLISILLEEQKRLGLV